MKKGFVFIPLSAFAVLSACGAYQGDWPRLLPSDASDIAFKQEGIIAAQAEQERADAQQILEPKEGDPAELAALNIRTSQSRTAFNALVERYEMQKDLVENARERASGGRYGPSSKDWATTQLELTRLGQITRDMSDVRVTAAQITADIAALSARGLSVDAALSNVGRLISRIDATLNTASLYRREVAMSLSDTQRP